jgi:riboflavin kinase/FMN adenylyltransferase
VVTIGNFDGVHLGHRALLARARALADAVGVPVCAFTFDPAPRDVLRPDNGIPRIQCTGDKVQGLGEAGAEHVVVEPFDLDLARRGAEWFAREVLGDRLGATAVVVGWDFRFGRGREGTAEGLRAWLDAPVEQVAPVQVDGRTVSSSGIREAIRAGALREAAALLGRPHEVRGLVESGDARGRRIGFPTANLSPRTPLVPPPGVYAVRVALGPDEWVPGVANLGTRPTFGGQEPRFEVHLLDRREDLYGRELVVRLIERLRDERRFPDADALVAQIHADIERARAVLG